MKKIYLAIALFIGSQAFASDLCKDQIRKLAICRGKCTKKVFERFVSDVEASFDFYPEKIQKAFCKMRVLALEDLEGSNSAFDGLNFRKGLYSKTLSVSHWATWKDQLNFGLKNDDTFPLSQKFPKIEIEIDPHYKGTLFVLLAHEIGHNLRLDNEQVEWARLTNQTENKITNAERLCKYRCANVSFPLISGSEIKQIYQDLYLKTNYLSLYSVAQPQEDFAELFAFYVLSLLPHSSY